MDHPDSRFDLQRFVDAQDRDGTYDRALAELRRGRKRSHWMWFVFPQIAGLGRSATAQHYALASVAEARSYLADTTLGRRLRDCADALQNLDGPTALDVFGEVDAMKLRSSLTLFALAAPDEPIFTALLAQYFHGEPDPATVQLAGGQTG